MIMDNLPCNVFEYLLEKITPYSGLLIIETDDSGVILDFSGEYEHYFKKSIERGDHVEDHIASLMGLLPLHEESVVLNKIELPSGVIADIHLIKESNRYWIVLVDQTDETEKIRPIIQDMNEKELNRKNGVPNYFQYYHILDFASFKKNGGDFQLLPEVPQWLKEHDLFDPKANKINPLEAFPFLEVFVVEADDFWEEKENGYIVSELWSEEINDKLLHLRAFAVNYQRENYLLVKVFNKEGKDEQKLVQAYRDSSLAFDKLAKAERKLKQLLDYKNKFNSIISHDLRSPIASVLGAVDMILSDKNQLEKIDELYRELLFDIRNEMERLLDYNDKLYHWANLELGNFKLDLNYVALEKILKTAYKTALVGCEKKGLTLHLDVDPAIEVNVDEALFLQALNNLLSNAIKFTPKGASIHLSGKEKEGKVEIKVKDSGVGIEKEVLKTLFKKQNMSSTLGTMGEKGTGLGLDIIKKIIDAHGFQIEVDSTVGKGTTFSIIIPADSVKKG